MKRHAMDIVLLALCLGLSACYNALSPTETTLVGPGGLTDRSIPIGALNYVCGDLNDPAEIAKLARADILILSAWQFWETSADLSLIRQANPDIKIVAYFSVKAVQTPWAAGPEGNYTRQLYDTAMPYLAHTTTGDTASDWYGSYLYNFTIPAARSAMLDIFEHFQNTSSNQFDGVFWDYFPPRLYVPADIKEETGLVDLDENGIDHWNDPDEVELFQRSQEAWIDEMRARMGDGFIQIANGVRALEDSTFAAKVDGMFYEDFPAQGYNGAYEFRMALDPAQYNNLFTARTWPRTQNGGPWLLLSHLRSGGTVFGPYPDYSPIPIDADDLTRAVAMLTDATTITYDGTGTRSAGIPEVEYYLGAPLGGVTIRRIRGNSNTVASC